ncbi:MAG: amidohydrolase family protein [Gemmatimonadales bacterium]
MLPPFAPIPSLRALGTASLTAISLVAGPAVALGQGAAPCAIAIVGATVIDGNGGPPVTGGTVLVRAGKIEAVGSRVAVPGCARRIEAAGKFVTPGFIDTNVHISLGGSMESNIRYQDQRFDITLEGAQLHLKHGVTTLRDSYGIMKPLLAVRDAIARGEVVGPRLYVAGNIVGWGGFFAPSFGPPRPTNLWQEQLNDAITEGSGEEWMYLAPDSLRVEMNRYLDKGVDFVKFGGTVHTSFPTPLVFSPRQVKVIVDETHRRGKIAETHATSPEGLLIALQAGVDLVQHPEVLETALTDELMREFLDRKVICSMNINSHTGKSWRDYLATRRRAETEAAEKNQDTSRGTRTWPKRDRTQHEIFESTVRPNIPRVYRANAERLVREGCLVSVATDNDLGTAVEFDKDPGAWRAREPGVGTLISIEGLVELGMTPMQALVAATKHGAMASKALAEYGTIEPGKRADLLLLRADPSVDIRNIRQLEWVMRDGAVIDPRTLPTKPIYSRSTP